MKNIASISRIFKYLLSKQWFWTVSGISLQIKSENTHRSNIFLIEALSMLTSPQIKTVKPHDKKPGISDRSSFCVGIALNFNSFGRNCVTTFPWPGCFKSMFFTWFIHKIPKILRVFAQDVHYGAFYRKDDLSMACQCPQLKLNPVVNAN